MQVNITLSGNKEFIAKLKEFRSEVFNFKNDFATIGEYLVKYYSTTPFFTQGGVYGQAWAALTAGTQAYKGKHYPGRPPLIRTGVMASSFAFQSTTTMLTLGNTTDYFKYHQSSAARTSTLPRRVIMAINKTLAQQIAATMQKGIIDRYRAL